MPALAFGKRRLPQPAHRLDTDTAGCLVLGRTKPALAALGALFASGRVEKIYWAVVRGAPPESEGEVDAPLLKRSTAREGWRMVVDPARASRHRRAGACWGGRTGFPGSNSARAPAARTRSASIARISDARSWAMRATAAARGVAMHLLARAVALPLEPPVAAMAPPPEHMRAALSACGWLPGAIPG